MIMLIRKFFFIPFFYSLCVLSAEGDIYIYNAKTYPIDYNFLKFSYWKNLCSDEICDDLQRQLKKSFQKESFFNLCQAFSRDPERLIEMINALIFDFSFRNFLDMLIKKYTYNDEIFNAFRRKYFDYWFTQNPVFFCLLPDHLVLFGYNKIFHDQSNIFKINTLFDLFLYFGCQMPKCLTKQYRTMYEKNHFMFFTNDRMVALQYYDYDIYKFFIYILKNRYDIRSLRYCIINFTELTLKKMIQHPKQLQQCFIDCLKKKKFQYVDWMLECIAKYRYFDLLCFYVEQDFKNYNPCRKNKTISHVLFSQLSNITQSVFTLLSIITPSTEENLYYDSKIKCNGRSYAQFIRTAQYNPYFNVTILKQVPRNELLLLMKELLMIRLDEHSNNMINLIKNIITLYLNNRGKLCIMKKQRLLYEHISKSLDDVNIYFFQELFVDKFCNNWLNTIRDIENNNILHKVFNKKGCYIDQIVCLLINNFPSLIKEKNNNDKTPYDVYREEIDKKSNKISDSVLLAQNTIKFIFHDQNNFGYNVQQYLEPLEEETVKMLIK